MIPIIAAALCLYVARSDQPLSKPTQPHASKPLPVVPEVPPTTQPMVIHTRQAPMSINHYQQHVLQPSIFEAPVSAECKVAHLLMGPYLSQPHVEHAQSFDSRIFEDGERVQSFQRRYELAAGNRLWQITTIDSPYGHIYLSLMLNDDGSIPADTAGVLVTYDNDGTEAYIAQTEAKQMERFGRRVFNYEKVLVTENQLRLFLGDAKHPHPVSHYFHQA